MADAGQKTATQQDIRKIVNKNTQQRKRKRTILNIILILLFLLLLIGLGFLTYFIVYNSIYTPPKDVVLTIHYSTHEVIGDNDSLIEDKEFSFGKGESSGIREPEFVHDLPAEGYLRLDYNIENKSRVGYRYNIDFSELLQNTENCDIKWELNNDGIQNDLSSGDVVDHDDNGNLLISVYLRVIDPDANAHCSGKLVITISVI